MPQESFNIAKYTSLIYNNYENKKGRKKMDLKNEVITNFKKVSKKDVTLDSNIKDLGLDSLDIVDLLMDLEDKYGVEFENEEMTSLATVGDVVKAVESKIK